ncbi:hypothetical protein HAX54_005200 [Datura stramonium]|uniref:Uncharacterized protein n=1 Tax=Datura stramonium TaxID=4076 RepID=A0ABS8T9M7_DATST|nr:hypothetical protein [Datura stramonium]
MKRRGFERVFFEEFGGVARLFSKVNCNLVAGTSIFALKFFAWIPALRHAPEHAGSAVRGTLGCAKICARRAPGCAKNAARCASICCLAACASRQALWHLCLHLVPDLVLLGLSDARGKSNFFRLNTLVASPMPHHLSNATSHAASCRSEYYFAPVIVLGKILDTLRKRLLDADGSYSAEVPRHDSGPGLLGGLRVAERRSWPRLGRRRGRGIPARQTVDPVTENMVIPPSQPQHGTTANMIASMIQQAMEILVEKMQTQPRVNMMPEGNNRQSI